MKQLERRIAKLEAQTAGLRTRTELAELERVLEFISSAEIGTLVEIGEENDGFSDKLDQFKARAAIRRQDYPRLWSMPRIWSSGWSPAVEEPWLVEREMDAFRSEIGKHWEWIGFCFLLDKLDHRELEIMDSLRDFGPPHYNCLRFRGSWRRVRNIATVPEIEQTVSKVWFDSRVINVDPRIGPDK